MYIGKTLKDSIEKIIGYIINPLNMNEDDLIELLEDVVNEYERLQEEYEDYKRNVEDNYKPIPVSEQYGISEREFY